MKNAITRKDFLKKACLAGFCFCGFNKFGFANVNITGQNSNTNNSNNIKTDWLMLLLSNLDSGVDNETKRNILSNCALAHYNNLNMDTVLAPYKNNIDAFIGFLQNNWNWKVEYNPLTKTIIADENKDYCVCPIVNSNAQNGFKVMRYCSEGFARLMFSFVLQQNVDAKVVSSICNGDSRCVYKITIV